MNDDQRHGLLEIGLGGGLMTTTVWGPMLEQMVHGAHAIAAISGAIIGLRGLYKMVRGRRRFPR